MSRICSLFTVAALMIPPPLMAGGPPRLCLPIDGVTEDNADDCAKLLAQAVKRHSVYDDVVMRQQEKQWYLTVYLGDDVRLSQIEAALKGSDFRVPHDKLRFFGHVILEIDLETASAKEVLKDLEAMDYVAVAESKGEKDMLLVTVDMPYPQARDRESIDWISFGRGDFSTPSTRSESPTTAEHLPSYEEFRAVVAGHNATLKEARWSMRYACRSLGCVAVTETKVEANNAIDSGKE